MSRRRQPIHPEHLGLLAGGLALLALLVAGMGNGRNWWTRSLELNFRTFSASGLQPGMEVKISGFPVGHVQRIQLLSDAQVKVSLSIAANRAAMVGRRSRATLTQDGLIGKPYIAITPDLNDLGHRQALANGDSLIYETSPDLASLIRQVAASRVPLQQVITRAGTLMEKRLPQSLNQLDRTLSSGEQLSKLLQREVSSGSGLLQGRVSQATDNLEQTLSTVQATLVEIQSLARSSNQLLRGIRNSWLLQMLEPAATPPAPSGNPINPTPPAPAAPAKPAAGCPGGAPCRD